ncbi:hypothetical protein ACKC6T_09095 [Klebsiella quasipneumoniae subsp. quasipneumoniae]|nr:MULTISPECIES: hypothetical protein [Klebsiella]HBS0593830.1 hypothetical protein [Klebsiella quasipneumoniae subsp. quasipneumoniae]KMI94567.1 hypothetical protein SN00_00967 [Klebsiella pneumoniae]MBW7051112.1 hypothetical protein [Klebsiella pneumoniae]MCB3676357.1 hypothetical protein [Klebsiella pneumoniae]MCB3735966.1 hypothetical protein [Klebsiella pneumoniae]
MKIHWQGKRIGYVYSILIVGVIIQTKMPDYAWVITPLLAIILSIEKE